MNTIASEKIYLSISIFRMGLAIIQTLFTKTNELIEYIENQLKANVEWGHEHARNFILTKNA